MVELSSLVGWQPVVELSSRRSECLEKLMDYTRRLIINLKVKLVFEGKLDYGNWLWS